MESRANRNGHAWLLLYLRGEKESGFIIVLYNAMFADNELLSMN